MDPVRWMLKAKRWAQKPPSMKQVIFTLAVIAACLALAAVEWFGLWPEWLRVNSLRAGRP